MDMYLKWLSYARLLGQVRVSHQCVHQLKKEARGGVAARPGKNRVVALKIGVKGEVEHRQRGS